MIDTVAITSSHSGAEYNLYIFEGVARGCTCKFRHYNHFKPCRHMNEYNEQVSDVTPHIEEELLNSCCVCGYPTKGVICYKCLA